MNLIIVYFVWINPQKNYMKIITGQMRELARSGILNTAELHVVLSCQQEEIVGNVQFEIDKILSDYSYDLDLHRDNQFEYYGIKKLWESALKNPEKIHLYFHAKGMSDQYANADGRHPYERFLTKRTIGFAFAALELFDNDDKLMKIGLFPSRHHLPNDYIWLNFYFARGSYLATCEKPQVCSNRYYYETWSGTGLNNNNDSVFNIYEQNYRKYLLNEVGDILNEETNRSREIADIDET